MESVTVPSIKEADVPFSCFSKQDYLHFTADYVIHKKPIGVTFKMSDFNITLITVPLFLTPAFFFFFTLYPPHMCVLHMTTH